MIADAQRRRFRFWQVVLLLVSFLAPALLHAQAVVQDCTQDDLLIALESGGDVTFSEGCSITITNTIPITQDMTIDASGFDVTLSGSSTRIFDVHPGVTLTVLGVTFQNGESTNGGAMYIFPGAVVTLSNCIFTANSAIGTNGTDGHGGQNVDVGIGDNGSSGTPGQPGLGGAIYNGGELSLFGCAFVTNTVAGGNGGKAGNGGSGSYEGGNGGRGGDGGDALGAAIYSPGSLVVNDCTFSANSATAGNGAAGGTGGSGAFTGYAGNGGAGGDALGTCIYSVGTNATVLNSTFQGNTARGGNSAPGGTLSNGFGATGSRGGHGMGAGVYTLSSLWLTNCTFTTNAVWGGTGGKGGPGNYTGGDGGNGGTGAGAGVTGPGTKFVVNSTFYENSATGGSNGVAGAGPFSGQDGSEGGSHGGNVANLTGSFTLINNILGTNSVSGHSAYGTFLDGGNNILADSSIKLGASSRIKTDPKLGSYGNHGGATFTFTLQTNSPAIDAGNDAATPPTDQRGVPRPVGPHSDIGSVEFTFTISGRVTTSNSPLAGVLIQAGDNTATTDSSGYYTIAASSNTLQVIPSLAGYVFTPASRDVTITNADLTSVNFTASRQLSLAGQVLVGTNGLPGVTITAGTNIVATTGTNGSFTALLTAGTYTVTPSFGCYLFQPTNLVVTVGSGTNVANFLATNNGFSVSGVVYSGTGTLAGVLIQVGTQSSVSDTNGAYTVTNICAGTNLVVPSLAGFSFSPSQIPVILGPSSNGVNFVAFNGPAVIGTLADQTNLLNGVVVSATSSAGTTSVVSQNGAFAIERLSSNTTYVLSPSLPGYRFSPEAIKFTATPTVYQADFSGSPILTVMNPPGSISVPDLSFTGNTGQTYQIEVSTNLANPAHWQTISTNLSPFRFQDSSATNSPQRFYRIR